MERGLGGKTYIHCSYFFAVGNRFHLFYIEIEQRCGDVHYNGDAFEKNGAGIGKGKTGNAGGTIQGAYLCGKSFV